MNSQMVSFLKLTLVGDGGVGKSCLILQYMYGDVSIKQICFLFFIRLIERFYFCLVCRRIRADQSWRISSHNNFARRWSSNRHLGHSWSRRLSGCARWLFEAWWWLFACVRLDKSWNVWICKKSPWKCSQGQNGW